MRQFHGQHSNGPRAAHVEALLRHGVRMTRSDATRLVEPLGGRSSDHVTGATDLVVAGFAPGSKLDLARRLRFCVRG